MILFTCFNFLFLNRLFAGGTAGTVSSCITNPLEEIKMQLKSSIVSVSAGGSLLNAFGHQITIAKNLLKQDGISGLFRGLPPTLICILPCWKRYLRSPNSSTKIQKIIRRISNSPFTKNKNTRN